MKVVLLKEVQGLGHAGETREVKTGYARNFLIPQGLADMATRHSLNVLEAQKKKIGKDRKLEIRNKKLEAEKINGKNFEIKVKTDEKGTLYSGLKVKDIATELEKQGYKIGVGEINLKKGIKKAGEYDVELNLGGEKAVIKLEVKSKNLEVVIA